MDKRVIEQYQEDEQMMIRLYVQWCINNEKDAMALYETAYPNQPKNKELQEIIDESEKNDLHISVETVLYALQLFGNDDLAFVVSEESQKR